MENISDFIKTLDYAVVIIYLLILLAIGYWVSFIKKKTSKDKNLFLAGNSLNATSIGLTMWGTNVGPSMLIASCSIGYTTGIVAGNFSWLAFPFLLLLAFVFAPKYLDAKTTTLPEFMGKRFGPSTRNILAWYSSLTIFISWLGLTLLAGGIVVQQMLGLPFWLGCVILVSIAVFFTVAGGLEAIALTNVYQMILLILVSFALTAIGVYKAGGLMNIFESTPDNYWNLLLPLDDPNYPWIALILGYPVLGIWFWCTDQSMVQSVLGAKNLTAGQMGTNLTAWLKILDVILFILPGITCFVLFPNLGNPDEAYMTMVTQLLPSGAIGLILAVIIASLISTIDSALNSLSTVFTMDIYVKKFKPEASNRDIINTGRIVTGIGALGAILIAIAINNLKGLNLFDLFQAILGFLAPPLSVVFLLGVLWKKMTSRAANLILSLGTLISIGTGALYLWVFPSSEYDFWPHFLMLSFYLFVLLAVMAWLISVFDRRGIDQNTLVFSTVSKPKKNVKIAWGLLVAVMVTLYIIFNGHGSNSNMLNKAIAPAELTIKKSHPDALIELQMPIDSVVSGATIQKLESIGVEPANMLAWKNHLLINSVNKNEVDKLKKTLGSLNLGEVRSFKTLFYDYNRSWCTDTIQDKKVKELYMSTNMVADESKQNEYLMLHSEQPYIWKELSEGFCSTGFQYIRMYKNGRRIIMIVGYPADADLGEMSKQNAGNNPKVQEWDALMLDYQEKLPNAQGNGKWIAFEALN